MLDTITHYLDFIAGGCGLLYVGFLLGRKSKKINPALQPVKEIKEIKKPAKIDPFKDCRRGIFEEKTSLTTYAVQFEVIEIERTPTKSKIYINDIENIKPLAPIGNESLKELRNIYSNRWVESKKIEWIENKEKVRDEKIEEILKKEENGAII